MTKNNSLIIGETSQLSNYFPESYDRISSRNIDFTLIEKKQYDTIYLLFAEQRTFLNESEDFFNDINVNYTLDVIEKVYNFTEKVVVYSTSELWNDYDKNVDVDLPYKYNYSPYIHSKELLSNIIKNNKDKYKNVVIIYPFNFNSPFRGSEFLFGKIFNSIINKEKITIGDVNFERDMVHPLIIVKESLNATTDKLIGTGELINVKKFICDIFLKMNLNINDYIEFGEKTFLPNTRKNYYSNKKYSNYEELITLTINDIYEYSSSQRHNRQ